MAKYDKSKFYWLQLKEDFFDEDAIDWLEEQPNGKEYVLFYLKLCLKSLKTNGILIRQVGNVLVPYDYKKLGELTKTNPDTVLVAMELLMKIGLVQKLESGEFYMTQLEKMIGSQSKSASKKQQQRIEKKEKELLLECKNEEGGQEVDNCPPKIDIKDRYRDRDIINSNNTILSDSKDEEKKEYQIIIDYLNEKANKNYRYSTNKTKTLINARLKEGFTVDDFKKVIDNKVSQWLNTEYEEYLRPETLFGTKFEGYLNQQVKSKQKYVSPYQDQYDKNTF